MRAIVSQLRRLLTPVVEQGVTPALPDPLKKRIRLTNGLSLFGAFVMVASIPFDWSHAPGSGMRSISVRTWRAV